MATKTQTRTTALARAPRARTIRVVEQKPARRRARSRPKSKGMLGTGVTPQMGVVSYGLGAMQRAGRLNRIPTVMNLGAEATIAVVAGYMAQSQGGGDLARDVAIVAGIVALNSLGREGWEGTPSGAGGIAGDDPYEVLDAD